MHKDAVDEDHAGKILIFCRSIVRNGKTIYPRNARFFRFWIDPNKRKTA